MKVIKLGGRVQSDPALIPALASLWESSPGNICIVHGGGDEISSLQRALGREPSFVNGRRITTEDDIELVRMVLSGSANKRLVAALSAAGVPAAGISGEDADLLAAEPIDIEQFGRSGKPVRANTRIIETLTAAGFLPVISPVGTDTGSGSRDTLNVNGDDAAAVIAGALGGELWLVADVAGVLNENREVIARLDQSATDALVAHGTVNKGMLAKLEAAFAALNAGASGARIAGLDALAGNGIGTMLSLTPSLR
ncbi:MAG TPA: acetylglutamate kinase [Gemmatimonadaceae bacterium]